MGGEDVVVVVFEGGQETWNILILKHHPDFKFKLCSLLKDLFSSDFVLTEV